VRLPPRTVSPVLAG